MGIIMVYKPTYNWGAPSCTIAGPLREQHSLTATAHLGLVALRHHWGPTLSILRGPARCLAMSQYM